MSRHLIFLDLESNGLDHRVHDAWEVAWWNLTSGRRGIFLPYLCGGDHGKFLANAGNLTGLRKSRFIDRWTDEYRSKIGYGQQETKWGLEELAVELWPGGSDHDRRSVVIAAQPKFDLPFLAKLYAANGMVEDPWFYRAPDLGSYAMGKLDTDLDDPPGAATVAEWCGVAPGDHSAWNDVTSGGRCVLLLREFGRLRRAGQVDSWAHFRQAFAPAQEEAIDQMIDGVVIPA